ncbi:MAG: glycosyltransferase family 39 protein [Candidatus Aenigmarchaeota archaeon]|nr:glycosyltransferase family 39 protein [Candidatus Aenigmarchaeota archaeon]
MELNKDRKKLLASLVIFLVVLFSFFMALKLRATPALINPPWLPQFDSYWFYRYAKMTVDNRGSMPDWDPLSYFPPGRPTDKSTQFYTYLLAYSFMLGKQFLHDLSLVQSVKWTAAILASLSVFPAYFIGKYMGGRVAGLVSAILIAVSPSILVRTGADPDNDGAVVFLTMFSFFAITRLIREPNWKNTVLSIFSLSLFSLSWYPFWYVVMISVGGLFLNVALSFVQSAIEKDKKLLNEVVKETKPRLKYVSAVLLGIIAVPFMLGVNTLSYFGGFILFGTNPQGSSIVNISVAELQKLNILSLSGWEQIIGRTAGLEFFGYIIPSMPQLVNYLAELVVIATLAYMSWNLYSKKRNVESSIFGLSTIIAFYLLLLNSSLISFLQITTFVSLVQYAMFATFRRNRFMGSILLVWVIFTFYAISSGVRFTLLFAPAAAIALSVGLGELWIWANRKEAGLIQSIENKIHGDKDE